jgi:ribonuclease Z
MLSLGYFCPGFDVLAGDLDPGDEVVFAGFRVRAVEADHTVPALCYVLEEDPRPGKFNPARAKELGVTEGPAFRVLQEGGRVQVGGQEILPEMVMGPKRRGRKLFISGDTRPHARLVEAASGADLMIQEATLLSDLENEAREYGHSTAQQAGRAAAQAKAKLLYLYHFSNRYEDVSALVEEARKEFPNTFAAEDLLSLQVNPPEEEWNRANKD